MAVFRLCSFVALTFLSLSVDDSVSTTPVTAKSEIKPLKGALLTNLTSLTTRPTTDRSSPPVITTEFKRGQYNTWRLLLYSVLFKQQCLTNCLVHIERHILAVALLMTVYDCLVSAVPNHFRHNSWLAASGLLSRIYWYVCRFYKLISSFFVCLNSSFCHSDLCNKISSIRPILAR